MMKTAGLFAAAILSGAVWAAPQPFDANDLVNLDRVGAPALSPDGETAAFAVRSTDYQANKAETSLWTASLTERSPSKRVGEDVGAADPQWSPDSSGIYFLASDDDIKQLWHLP